MYARIAAQDTDHSAEYVTVETRIRDGRVAYLSIANEEVHWALGIGWSRDNLRRLIEALEVALAEPHD